MSKIFWLSGNVPSLKNTKVWTGRGLANSKTVKKWLKHTKPEFLAQRVEFVFVVTRSPRPYYIEFTFIRGNKAIFDYCNMVQIVLDAMSENGWIWDDNADMIKPYFGDYRYDKENPGVEIRILRNKPKHYSDE